MKFRDQLNPNPDNLLHGNLKSSRKDRQIKPKADLLLKFQTAKQLLRHLLQGNRLILNKPLRNPDLITAILNLHRLIPIIAVEIQEVITATVTREITTTVAVREAEVQEVTIAVVTQEVITAAAVREAEIQEAITAVAAVREVIIEVAVPQLRHQEKDKK